MAEARKSQEGLVKITIEITPSEEDSKVRPFKKAMEFHISYDDLPIKVFAESARVVTRAERLAEEMCED